MLRCSKKDTCVNYKIRCFDCGAMSDCLNPYPRYVNKEQHEERLLDLLGDVPDMLDNLERFPWKRTKLVKYLVEHGVRVEVD